MSTDNPIAQLVHFVSVTEQLVACIRQATFLVESIRAVVESDNELVPELLTAITASGELAEALARAQEFASARLEVALGDG